MLNSLLLESWRLTRALFIYRSSLAYNVLSETPDGLTFLKSLQLFENLGMVLRILELEL